MLSEHKPPSRQRAAPGHEAKDAQFACCPRPGPGEAGHVRKGGATERMSFLVRGEAKDAQFAGCPRSGPGEAGHVRKGGATERLSFPACGEANDAQFAGCPRSGPGEAGHVRKGGATERLSFPACGEANDAQFAGCPPVRARRSGPCPERRSNEAKEVFAVSLWLYCGNGVERSLRRRREEEPQLWVKYYLKCAPSRRSSRA